MPYPTHHML